MRIFILISILALTSLSCRYAKNVQLLTGGDVQENDFRVSIPFQYHKGIIVVSAKLNSDTVAREFIFDTGAFNSKIVKGLALELDIPVVTSKKNTDSQGNEKIIEVGRVDSLILGEVKFYNIGAGLVEYGEGSATPCLASHGIIGANLIGLANWKVDYQNKLIHLSNIPFEPGTDNSLIEYSFNKPALSGTPEITISLGGEKIKEVLVDLGSNGGLTLPESFVPSYEGVEKEIYLDQSTTGIYGSKPDRLITMPLTLETRAGNFNIPVDFSQNRGPMIGNDFLEHFRVYLNYDRKIIQLQPASLVSIDPQLEFIPGILNDSLWVVNRAPENNLLQLGDTLRSINGKKPSEMFTDFCDYFMEIRKILESETLWVEKTDGSRIKVK